MAKYTTRKNGAAGKTATLTRRQETARKYAPAPSLKDTARAVGAPLIVGGMR